MPDNKQVCPSCGGAGCDDCGWTGQVDDKEQDGVGE